jgi:hypothetical protein
LAFVLSLLVFGLLILGSLVARALVLGLFILCSLVARALVLGSLVIANSTKLSLSFLKTLDAFGTNRDTDTVRDSPLLFSIESLGFGYCIVDRARLLYEVIDTTDNVFGHPRRIVGDSLGKQIGHSGMTRFDPFIVWALILVPELAKLSVRQLENNTKLFHFHALAHIVNFTATMHEQFVD